MIVCDRCGKPVKHQSSLIMKRMNSFPIKKEPGRSYPASLGFIESETHYDLCQECLDDSFKILSEFVKQGKFKLELNNG